MPDHTLPDDPPAEATCPSWIPLLAMLQMQDLPLDDAAVVAGCVKSLIEIDLRRKYQQGHKDGVRYGVIASQTIAAQKFASGEWKRADIPAPADCASELSRALAHLSVVPQGHDARELLTDLVEAMLDAPTLPMN